MTQLELTRVQTERTVTFTACQDLAKVCLYFILVLKTFTNYEQQCSIITLHL